MPPTTNTSAPPQEGQQLLLALKQQLKAQGITYRQVAHTLNLSEASVKRLLNSRDISLSRLETIAALAHCSLSELSALAKQRQTAITALTLEQEKVIAEDLPLLMVAISVISGFQFRDLLEVYDLKETDLIQKLAQLDRLGLIELLPGNRIRLRVAPNFGWQPAGPIQQFFLQKVVSEFFASQFNREPEKLLVFNGLCSPTTNQKLQSLMTTFFNEAVALSKEDRPLALVQKHGNTLVLALRQWQYPAFEAMKPQNATSPC